MTPFTVMLVLASAGFHVITHVALKQSRDRSAFVWWMLIWAGVLFLPIPILSWTSIPTIGWGLMAFSAVFEAAYFAAIALAYRGADLSVVYPLARGTAPVLLMVWSIVFLNESLTLGGILGILTITVGLYTVNLPKPGAWREPLRALRRVGPRWAVAAGVCTSAYTAIDKVGIGYVPPLLYTYLALWMSVVLLTPWTLRLVGRAGLRAEIGSSRGGTILAGFTTLAAYGLVLLAMSRGMPAAYAGALREISVVLGAAYGVLVLKEQGGRMRILGASFVALGAVMIGFLG
jgi:drug/metabolite transporter (DMT)-like permease